MKNVLWAVLGRGIIGLTAAYRLLQAGYSVIVIGPRSREGIGSTAALGNFTSKGLVISDHGLLSAKVDGQQHMRRLIDELEQETATVLPKISGIFEVFSDPISLSRLRQRIYHNDFSSLFSFQSLNSSETKERSTLLGRYGNLGEGGGSLFYPDDFWVDPPSLLDALETAIMGRGGHIIDAMARSLRPVNQNEMRIDFGQGEVVVNDVFIAAGVQTNTVLAGTDFAAFPLLKSPGITFEAPAPDRLDGSITSGRKGIRVWNSSMRFGSYDNYDGIRVDPTLIKNIDGNGIISQIVARALLDSGPSCEIREIKGTRSFTKDRLPIFGSFSPFLGFSQLRPWVATAFYKIGFYLADYCAQNLIQSLQGQGMEAFCEDLSPLRFAAASKCMI